MVWCGYNNKDRKDICFKEIGLCAQTMITILDSIVNMIEGDLCDHVMKIFIRAPQIVGKVAMGFNLDL